MSHQGVHSYIPVMTVMADLLPAKLYSTIQYQIFKFLFSWNDSRWDKRLIPRFLQFSPTQTSAEAMRWWLSKGASHLDQLT
jgi:hypothetical protein